MLARMARSVVNDANHRHKARRAPWKAFAGLLHRLNDPQDTHAALLVSATILMFEAVICPLIIANVPCGPHLPV